MNIPTPGTPAFPPEKPVGECRFFNAGAPSEAGGVDKATLAQRWGAFTQRLARSFACVLALVSVAGNAPAGEPTVVRPESVGMSAQRLKRLADEMRALVDQGHIAGIVTMVAKDGKVVHFEAAGKRDIASGAPMRKDTIFRIYSMTKPITGVAMMMLYEEGKWQLNDPVSKYIPEFAHLKVARIDPGSGALKQVEPHHPMTMLELLSHTGGLTIGTPGQDASAVDKMYRDAKVMDPDQPLQVMIDKLAKIPLLFQPGEHWHYSLSVDVQAYLVEKLSGQSFDRFLQERIFAPLKMTDTAFFVPPDKRDRFTEFYMHDAQRNFVPFPTPLRDFEKMPVLTSGSGGLVSTAGDYLRFSQMLLNGGQLDGQRLLSPLTVRMMRSNVLPATARTVSPGIGFGLNFGVIEDPLAAGGYGGAGTFYWGGFAGTWFWIDPVYKVIMIAMAQHRSEEMEDIRSLTRALTYQAIVSTDEHHE